MWVSCPCAQSPIVVDSCQAVAGNYRPNSAERRIHQGTPWPCLKIKTPRIQYRTRDNQRPQSLYSTTLHTFESVRQRTLHGLPEFLFVLCSMVRQSITLRFHSIAESSLPSAPEHAAEEPEHEKDGQYQARSAPEPSSAIPAIPVIATTAAEQQDDYDNDQDWELSLWDF